MGWRYSTGRGLQWSDIMCTDWDSRFICQRLNGNNVAVLQT